MTRKTPLEEALGKTAHEPEIVSLADYCRQVLERVTEKAGAFASAEASAAWHAQHLAPDRVRAWIAQEQHKAFYAGASVEDCASWIYQNVTDPRGIIRQ